MIIIIAAFPRKSVHMTGQIHLWANTRESTQNYKERQILPNRPASWQQAPQGGIFNYEESNGASFALLM